MLFKNTLNFLRRAQDVARGENEPLKSSAALSYFKRFPWAARSSSSQDWKRMGERRGTKALEAWCKRVTQGYNGVKVENMTTSWRDGLAFCALIHHFRPDLIDFESLSKSDVIGNNELAFRIAERHLGIPALLDAEDMAEYPVPDRLSILTYLSQFYQVFSNHSASPVKKIPNDSDSSIASLSDVSSPNMEGAPPWGELCVVCDHPVYLAQRLRVQGNLYHRTCFRCARCTAQLTLVDYYETHDGKFCCETCPDEVTAENIPDPPKTSEIELPLLEIEESHWKKRPSPTPELSPSTRQSIVAMRRMFFDTDDAKLTRCETLRSDLPPADIPISPNDKVKPQNVHSPVADKSSDSPKQSSIESPNTGACVEYQSDNASPSPSRRRLVDKSNYSSLKLAELEDKSSPIESNGRTSKLSDTISAKSDKSPSPRYTDKIGVKVLPALPTKLVVGKTTVEKDDDETIDTGVPSSVGESDKIDKIGDASDRICSDKNSLSHEVNDKESAEYSNIIEEESNVSESLKSKTNEKTNLGDPDVSVNGDSDLVEGDKINFGENEGEKETQVVEAVNQHLGPPARPQRRLKSPIPRPREIKPKPPPAEYPEDLNPFGEDDDDEEEPSRAGTNPFGSDSEEEFDNTAMTSTPLMSPAKAPARYTPSASPSSDRRMSDFSPVRKAPSLNPFGDPDEEEEEEKPVPLPRNHFPRGALRASQRSIASTVSTSSRKKRPAPPPPTPPSPTNTIRSTRSRKTRRAPLPPGMASSRLSLASDTISVGGFSIANESIDLPVQISAVTDRITEWVQTSKLETSFDTTKSAADDSAASHSFVETSAGDLYANSPASKLEASPHSKHAPPLPSIEVVEDSISPVKQDEAQNLKNKCHTQVPKPTETIAVTPTSAPSPIKIPDLPPSDEPLDNRIDPVIDISVGDNIQNDAPLDKSLQEKVLSEEENLKEISDKRKSGSASIGSDHAEHIIAHELKSEISQPPKKPPLTPRPLEPTISITNRNSLADSDVEDRLLNNKKTKDDVNMTRKISGSSTESSNGGFSLHKSTHGQWKRKKAPAPPLPLNPDQRTIKKDIPLLKIKQELNDIEIKQQGLERQGVALEARIRDKFDNDTSITPYVEELVLQLFELVNEKNELFRKQAELMYLRRQQHLEEEQADLEKEIRALMGRPEANKTDSDKELEEQLIQRLVEVVERRDAIVQCLEMDRIREAEEDRSISAQLNVFTKAMAPEDKSSTSPKKRKSHPEGNKKKWYTLSRSPKKTHS